MEADDPILQFLHTTADFPKPVIAAVGGAAVGIGTTLLLHCDLVYLADNARLQLPFVELGLVPEFASSLLLPRSVGHLKAAELLLLAEAIDADEALRLGLANRVLAAEALLPFAREQGLKLAAKAPKALQRARRCSSRSSGRRCTSSSIWRRAPSPSPCREKRHKRGSPSASKAVNDPQLRRKRPISSQPCT